MTRMSMAGAEASLTGDGHTAGGLCMHPGLEVTIAKITSAGDRILDAPLSQIGDKRVAALVACLHDGPTALALRAERALLGVLEGGCQIPIGAHGALGGAARDGEAVVPRSD